LRGIAARRKNICCLRKAVAGSREGRAFEKGLRGRGTKEGGTKKSAAGGVSLCLKKEKGFERNYRMFQICGGGLKDSIMSKSTGSQRGSEDASPTTKWIGTNGPSMWVVRTDGLICLGKK